MHMEFVDHVVEDTRSADLESELVVQTSSIASRWPNFLEVPEGLVDPCDIFSVLFDDV